VTDHGRLLGRDDVCAELRGLLDGARSGASGTLVLLGDPGVGKSALLDWAAEASDHIAVARVRGLESEHDLPYAGLVELCASRIDRGDRLNSSPAHMLHELLTDASWSGAGPPAARYVFGLRVLEVLVAGADGRPSLVLVDDAHWLDEASLQALLFAARRLRGEGVAILFAGRASPRLGAQATGLPTRTVAGLGPSDARALVQRAYPDLAEPVVEILVTQLGGNPLALREVPGTLTADERAGRVVLELPLTPGITLRRVHAELLAALPAATRTALLVAAADLSQDRQSVLSALRSLDVSPDALDAAATHGVLTPVASRLNFSHPLLRAAIYHEASLAQRRAVHAALAGVTTGYARLWHRVQASVGQDEILGRELSAAAEAALRRGALDVAVDGFRRAAEATADQYTRVARLVRSAHAAHLLGRQQQAAALLDRADEADTNGAQRASILHARGRVLVLSGAEGDAFEVLRSAAESCRAVDPGRAAEMLAEACLACVANGDIRQALLTAKDAHGLLGGAGPAARLFVRVVLACAQALDGQRQEALAELGPLVTDLRRIDSLPAAGELVTAAAQCCTWLELYDEADHLLRSLIAAARHAQAPAVLAWPLTGQAELLLRRGQWDRAAVAAAEAVSLATDLQQWVIVGYANCWLAWHAAALGEAAESLRLAALARARVDAHRIEPGRVYLGATLGFLELGRGRLARAVAHLEQVREIVVRHGLRNPNVVQWQGDLIESYVRTGRRQAAMAAFEAFDAVASTHDAGPWARGVAARCGALLAAGARADDRYGESVELLRSIPAPFEMARTQLCWGEALRRGREPAKARQPLRAASVTFAELRARGWLERSTAEFRAAGGRAVPPGVRPPPLTAQERQIVAAVAGGASNKQVAAALFLSTRTVEFHLANVYRKLELRSRTALTALAVREGWVSTVASPGENLWRLRKRTG
jgi:DNA-binding CsgD family transcriptional regulator